MNTRLYLLVSFFIWLEWQLPHVQYMVKIATGPTACANEDIFPPLKKGKKPLDTDEVT